MKRSPAAYPGLALLAIVSWISVSSLSPPQVAEDAGLDSFSARRAVKHLETIAREPHPVGSEGHARVRAYLVGELERLGLAPEAQDLPSFATQSFGWIKGSRIRNVIARLPGTGPEPRRAVVLMAHYDAVVHSRGANDDGAGVVTLLETARALAHDRAQGRTLANDILFLFTDAEEEGLLGAAAFVRHAAKPDIHSVILNFEARGNHGPVAMFETSKHNGNLIEWLARTAERPVASSLVASLAKALPNDTDLTMFRVAGYPGLNFAYAAGLERYHTFHDSLETIDPRSVQHHGSYSLGLTRELGRADLGAVPGPDVVYFDVLARKIVRYPTWVASALGIGIALLLLGIAWRRRHGPRLLVAGSVASVATLVLSALATGLFGALLGAISDPELLVIHSAAFVFPFLLTTAGAFLLVHRALWSTIGRRATAEGLALGILFPWVGLGAISGFLLPGASYILQFPPLFALVALLALASGSASGSIGGRALGWVAGAPIAALMSGLVYFIYIMDGLRSPAVVAAALALSLIFLVPLLQELSDAFRKRLGTLLLSGGLALGLIGAALLGYSAEHPKLGTLLYGFDADLNQGYWISRAAPQPAWVETRVPRETEAKEDAAFFATDDAMKLVPAPPPAGTPALAPPVARAISDETRGGKRELALRLASPRGARCLSAWIEWPGVEFATDPESEPAVESTAIEGEPVQSFHRFSPELDTKFWSVMTGSGARYGWKLGFCALTPEGIRLDLVLPAGKPFRLHLVDRSDGLPPGLAPRPAEVIPAIMSERILVRKSYEF